MHKGHVAQVDLVLQTRRNEEPGQQAVSWAADAGGTGRGPRGARWHSFRVMCLHQSPSHPHQLPTLAVNSRLKNSLVRGLPYTSEKGMGLAPGACSTRTGGAQNTGWGRWLAPAVRGLAQQCAPLHARPCRREHRPWFRACQQPRPPTLPAISARPSIHLGLGLGVGLGGDLLEVERLGEDVVVLGIVAHVGPLRHHDLAHGGAVRGRGGQHIHGRGTARWRGGRRAGLQWAPTGTRAAAG